MRCGCGVELAGPDWLASIRAHRLVCPSGRLGQYLLALRTLSPSRALVQAGYREHVPMSEETKAALRAYTEQKRKRRKELGHAD